MEKLILHPTPTSEWHSLVIDASKNCNISLSEELESYLVFLLMRYIKDVNLARKIVALDFLEGQKQSGNQKQIQLRDVGDTCLIFSGFFPEQATKRNLKVDYYVNIGQSAYNDLGMVEESSLSALFSNLSNSFVPLMDVLQSMRKYTNDEPILDPITAEELWLETGSQSALSDLKSYTDSSEIILNRFENTNKH